MLSIVIKKVILLLLLIFWLSPKAITLGESCNLNGLFCDYIGKGHYDRGEYAEAFKYFKKACDIDKDQINGQGCAGLGDIYKNARGLWQDDFKAVKYYQKACELGHIRSCKALKELCNLEQTQICRDYAQKEKEKKQNTIYFQCILDNMPNAKNGVMAYEIKKICNDNKTKPTTNIFNFLNIFKPSTSKDCIFKYSNSAHNKYGARLIIKACKGLYR